MNTKNLTPPQRREMKRIARRVRRKHHVSLFAAWSRMLWIP